MTEKEQLIKIIRDTINNIVYKDYKEMPKRLSLKREEMKKTTAQKEMDVHEALFGKEEDGVSYRLHLHENNKPKITTSELNNFEKEFKNRFPNVIFDMQNGNGSNGQIVDFPVINDVVDAVSSGKIIVEKESIKFIMSLVDGLKIQSEIINGKPKLFEINSETKDVFSKLLNLYEELFKNRFNQIINPVQDDASGEL